MLAAVLSMTLYHSRTVSSTGRSEPSLRQFVTFSTVSGSGDARETVETVTPSDCGAPATWLKPGVNERDQVQTRTRLILLQLLPHGATDYMARG